MQLTQLKKKFDKKGFDPGARPLKIISWYFINLLCFKSGLVPFSTILVALLKIFGAQIGKDVRIKPCIYIRCPWKLTLGDHSWLADCYIDNLDNVIIGKNVCVSQGAMLITGNHNYKSISFDLIVQPIVLEDGVWIGANTTICPGVIAGSHAVLTAGSVATNHMDPYFIYQGNPARKIKPRKMNLQKPVDDAFQLTGLNNSGLPPFCLPIFK